MINDDTIAAISTPLGEGGIGIVRISGKDSKKILRRVFIDKNGKKPRRFFSKKLSLGFIINPPTGERVDEVLLSYMEKPYTYTREDVVEINCHSGWLVLKKILSIVLDEGARIAEPGEFTKRAFLNGRIDLSQAEAVSELIRSKTEKALKASLDQLKGSLSEKYNNLKKELIEVISNLEAEIDFPEEELEILDKKTMIRKIENIKDGLENIIDESEKGKIYRDGIKTVIVGKPNVGKSSLLNALLKEQRAIVTEIPGTTRDTIEENILIKGIPLNLIDTAGLRKAKNIIEKIGVDIAKSKLSQADLTLFVVDVSEDLTKEDETILNHIPKHKVIAVMNKSDKRINEKTLSFMEKEFPITCKISALKEKGIKRLE
ncbi:MAG: tRNA uridine-5-carboxymethylaminomethyl(34) synthesis GTPase MnmE, partial [Actinomycetia bacterium]|nr:tRNA uridine-5-carboxymethylaminomethyl(34) synthesis GTPase MnmE [Actinomycetes bacterium]